ncbi:LUTEIN DEFICIENT 5, chloroplastic [Seminavis robusta]|uniref:LUTEIN DEFICIENT 5, chloroplastic n=1 Tax=Seminavis robusta TaxID=568900 RepID=A0A9N8HYX3_9STRA|nr:LUTEIN DEFICIENT 5, chloroplastic [Seminavis robusta]|eukprot:Sro2108_g314910.1 LUTEIN DEFICIENT 5, chloroplastic (625) ;mRNA; r:9861-11986
MRISTIALSSLTLAGVANGFVPAGRPMPTVGKAASLKTALFSTTEEETKTKEPKTEAVNGELNKELAQVDPDAEGLPWWWELVWKLDVMQKGKEGDPVEFGDTCNVLRTNIEQIYGGYPSLDGCPLAEGEITDIGDGTMFIGLQRYQQNYNSPYKLCFGPKSFLVISDPVQAKHMLRDANSNYDKGVLAEILEPIMGKGLIPADPETWTVRRRQIVPAFHQAWLQHMVGLFGHCNGPLIDNLNKVAEKDGKCDMETFFCSVALDIIGLSVFNFEFGSVTNESPVIRAVYSALVEAEHRSMTPAPYWDLPFANQLVPRLRKFNSDLKLLNDVLDDLINRAKNTRQVGDIEELEKRNYAEVDDPSMLRFLVDMRGADIDNKQLRDDLMTMLIAGHETTAAVLTWALFELTKHPEEMAKVREEIDRVVGDRVPTYEDMEKLEYTRLVIAETLRMYPEPPLLIRRCRTEDNLPEGGGREATVIRGMDIFMGIYTMHRDERFWPEPNKFDPMRFTRRYTNPDIKGWDGFDPKKWEGKLYPNEIAADFAYLPFGGGARKCVGDQFAIMEAIVTLTMVLRRFDFDFDLSRHDGKVDVNDHPQHLDHPVGMRTGATIHTRKGLHMIVKKREI